MVKLTTQFHDRYIIRKVVSAMFFSLLSGYLAVDVVSSLVLSSSEEY